MSEVIEHKHIIIRAETKTAPDEKRLVEWLKELVDKLNMKILAGPISGDIDYMEGNNGPTAVVVIETSHMACHVWTDSTPNLIQLDVYTCGRMDKQKVLNHLQEFQPAKIEYRLFDREYSLEELDYFVGGAYPHTQQN